MNDANGMKIKSYFAKTVDEAISKARVDLGSEALLLNTRKIADNGTGAGYEVVMGVAGAAGVIRSAPAPNAVAAVPAPKPAPSLETPVLPAKPAHLNEARPEVRPDVASDMEKLRAQMDELQSLLVRSAKNAWFTQRSVPEIADVYARLIAAEVDPVLSKDIADRLEAAMATDAFFLSTGSDPAGAQNRWKSLKSDSARMEKFLRAELESRVVLWPRLGVNGAKGAVAVLVGPTGSGKTTSLAKLAMAASAQRAVRLVSLDRSGTGVRQLLSSLATSAITFSSVDSIESLPKLVAEARKSECVLIDTRGFGSQERPAAEKLAAALAACGDVDVHLVTPAYMKARDLRNSIERYRLFQPSKLLVTRIDETESFGTVFSEAVLGGLALSFLSNGPRIPDDIRAATGADLLAMVQERPRARVKAA
jgi:flagellar biosynthesis protein FlhF